MKYKVSSRALALAAALCLSTAPVLAQEDAASEDDLSFIDSLTSDDAATTEETAAIDAEAEGEVDAEAEITVEDDAPRRPQLDEVIVTAQKRAENVQDVPISVSALSGETLKDNNISNLNDLSLYTPNVKLQAIAPFGRINMRGLGSGTNRGFEQSVGLVIDGVFFGRLTYLLDSMLDISRVEALRGPQGTLFGKNTIAGAMNISTGTPAEDWGFDGDVTIGEFEQRRYRAMVTGPITRDGDLKFRLAAIKDERDGHTYNTFLDRDELNTDNIGLRGKVAWDTDFGLSVTAGLTYTEFDQRSWAIQFTHLNSDDPTSNAYGLFDPNLEDDVENNKVRLMSPVITRATRSPASYLPIWTLAM